MKIAPAVAIVPLLVLLLTWLSLRAINPDVEMFDQAIGELDRFAMMENALYRDVYSARIGTLRNYDPLVREIDALHGSLDRLRETAAIDSETTAAVDQIAASVGRQEELVEKFKSCNALLHNSLTLFGRLSVSLASSDLGPAASAAAAAMLQLTLDTSTAAAREVADRLDELAKQASASADYSVKAMLVHGRLLHELLPEVDENLKAIRAVPRRPDQDALRAMLQARKSASRTAARQLRWLLYAISLLLVGCLVHFGLQLRARANALRRRAAFEHVIAGISMRFINAQPQDISAEIDRALATMAECIGCDRAYFVSAGPAPRRHLWHKPGSDFAPGWPDRAYELAARLSNPVGGVLHVPYVARMPPGEDKDTCLALGLGGWACVTNVDPAGARVVLGFDAIRQPCRITAPGELSLLPMALDTIVHSIARQTMERERARLETRLQQARRLETLGTFSSGIAHNFNNILGGIIGHSEVIEQRLGSDARLESNLGGIRRAAERARDLVDQILAFGRRRDAHREPLSVRALVAEAASLLNVSLPRDIVLSIDRLPPDAVVSGEPSQLQQVILNLCNNAAQAMENDGRIEVEAEMHDVDMPRSLTHGELGAGRHACIAVTDAGRGMDQTTLARIFEPFFTTRSDGNGLGLSTVREIVREHGGAINVASAPGKGSRLEVWLPCMQGKVQPAEAEMMTLPLGHGETVLVVATDHARLLRDEEMLAALGYEPVGFATADAAVAACRSRPERFDALVVGHFGSPIASLQLAAALHDAAPDLPIVLAAKFAQEIGADTLLAAGIADVVHWPIVAAEVAPALHHCLTQTRFDAAAAPSLVRGARSLAH
jgi:signal transduction histidine kinase/CheY-like chemotaxis protein